MHISETEMLRMALIGYGLELVKIEEQIQAVRAQLALGAGSEPAPKKKRKRMSAEGRARIVAAVHKRWAAYRREQKRGRK